MIMIGFEPVKTHPLIISYLKHKFSDSAMQDISKILSDLRMVKSPEEINTMRQAG